MHIPDGFINNQASFGLLAVSLAFVGFSVKKVKDSFFEKTNILIPKLITNTGLNFGGQQFISCINWKSNAGQKIQKIVLVFCLVFAVQMVDFVKINGVPGHLIGSFLAALVLGPWLGLLVISAVLATQAVFLGDGGITAMGANIFNMAIIGCFTSYYLFLTLKKFLKNKNLAIAFTSWISVMLMALIYSAEAYTFGFSSLVIQLILVHIIVGIADAALTIFAVKLLFNKYEKLH